MHYQQDGYFKILHIMRVILFTIFLLSSIGILSAQDGHKIEVEIANYTNDRVVLGYHLGDKQYIQDTSIISNGKFIFEDTASLDPGVYLLILPPKNNYCQILIEQNDQHFTFKTDAKNLTGNVQIKGSETNKLFYDYMEFLSGARPKVTAINEQLEKATEKEKKKLNKELDAVNEGVKKYQENILSKHPNSLTTAIIRAGQEVKIPKYEGTKEAQKQQQYEYYKTHYFDNVDLGDERLLRSPVLYKRVDYYLNKLTPQHPDSINISLDYLLNSMAPAEKTFKYYLVHYLNKYAKSKIVGMDAVYVHLVENYYAKGKAMWTDEEQVKKIIDNAKTLKPILIGKIAPDIKMRKKDKTPIALHEIDSKYTVLFFWDPDCGHCKKSMPEMIKFYEDYKPKGVEVFSVCTKVMDKVSMCWDTIEEKNMGNWLNVVDPYIQSRYKSIYDVKTTPRIFVLDENKKILSKRIGVEQLPELFDQIIKNEKAN